MNTFSKRTSRPEILSNEKVFQRRLRKVKKNKDYPLMVALADIFIDTLILAQKKKSNSI